MSRTLLVVAGICVVAMIAGCATNEGSKPAAKVEPAKPPVAKVEPAAEPKPTVQYVDTPTGRWMVHDENRPAPPIITPGDGCGIHPSDAIMLFDGTKESMANWTDTKKQPSKWVVGDGYMESVKGAGYVQTKQEFKVPVGDPFGNRDRIFYKIRASKKPTELRSVFPFQANAI